MGSRSGPYAGPDRALDPHPVVIEDSVIEAGVAVEVHIGHVFGIAPAERLGRDGVAVGIEDDYREAVHQILRRAVAAVAPEIIAGRSLLIIDDLRVEVEIIEAHATEDYYLRNQVRSIAHEDILPVGGEFVQTGALAIVDALLGSLYGPCPFSLVV